ncbi:MAG: amino acid dehydrogenase [Paraglaciecola sp.]|uniref:Glu/Leu/Phe/Val dehydrogenase dimerization domain-containing protein n=1 Tax=Paraglaciecola sp. TaxID=1920173 RepID=UPI00273EA864|nr:Glu/Leu/Phe/Val dehydrogenase dimerization domain-containing protein [Paraglaciecola sp.]MDP5030168.1 amino acid dehydrogenase [Paraglaciecola sp.]MDP5040254.1 amino acid dehydrogenase [Paraglaciecola sp.]MDP5130782.1 amino acid dehydrogenase [Paraglaciecola sp.]
MSVFEHIEFDQHEHVAFCHDKETGLKAIIAIHNTHLGASLGGCRMWPYSSDDEALNDVLRLSKGMTYKAAMAGLNQGGGKAVILGDPRKVKTVALMRAMGRFVDSLSGQYISAEDSGMSVADLKIMAEHSNHIAGIEAKYHVFGEQADGNPAPSTAYGVFVGLRTSVEFALGRDLQGVKVAIQGLGHVGMRLAEHLHKAGAILYVTDIYPETVEKAVSQFAAKAVSLNEIYDLDVDVFAPCAMGAILNPANITQIKAKVVAGAANNQLATEACGQLLREKGILYAPDYVINAGGIIDIYHQKIPSSHDAMKAHIERISTTLVEVYQRANELEQATNVVANQIAEERFTKKA